MLPPDPAGVFAAVAVTLYAAHALADHWVQTDLQARDKSLPGRVGRLACALAVGHRTRHRRRERPVTPPETDQVMPPASPPPADLAVNLPGNHRAEGSE